MHSCCEEHPLDLGSWTMRPGDLAQYKKTMNVFFLDKFISKNIIAIFQPKILEFNRRQSENQPIS
jgi:hypothetical protein